VSINKSLNQQVSKFLEDYVESILLIHYLSSNLKGVFYNQKVVGAFEKGNLYGGSPKSGKPSQAVCFQNYAWESESAAASSFDVDKKLLRTKIDNGFINIAKSLKMSLKIFLGLKFSLLIQKLKHFFMKKKKNSNA
jgi:hypothetical protein